MTLASPLLSGRLILQQHLLLLGLLGQPALSPQHCWSCSLAQSDSFMVLEICTSVGEGEGGMIWENGIETRIISYKKRIEIGRAHV